MTRTDIDIYGTVYINKRITESAEINFGKWLDPLGHFFKSVSILYVL